jgi:hypothetical protein
MRILFSGMLAGVPGQGGAAWAVLQYLLGLRRLGHIVYFVEPLDASALQPSGTNLASSFNAAYFRNIVDQFGFEECAALLLKNTRETVGLSYKALKQLAESADVLINVSGMLTDQELLSRISRRVYLDLDPAFIQFWHLQGIDMHLDAHTHFVTIARAMGQPECRVPTCGRTWITTLQPIVLEHWPVAQNPHNNALTTIANWRGYGSVEHDGVFYGQKAHSLRRFMHLPRLTGSKFMLALAIHPDEVRDLQALREGRWELVDPKEVAGTPQDYREFIQASKAEFGIAKSGYETARTGWFSDRSICYLASGRPVLAQETGYSRYLPTGEGLFSFASCDDVVQAIEELNRDYDRHTRAARALAEAYFDSDRVLNSLLQQVGTTTSEGVG